MAKATMQPQGLPILLRNRRAHTLIWHTESEVYRQARLDANRAAEQHTLTPESRQIKTTLTPNMLCMLLVLYQVGYNRDIFPSWCMAVFGYKFLSLITSTSNLYREYVVPILLHNTHAQMATPFHILPLFDDMVLTSNSPC